MQASPSSVGRALITCAGAVSTDSAQKTEQTPLVLSVWLQFRSIMLWLLLGGVLSAGGGGVYLFLRADQELRLYCQRVLARRYPQLETQVGEARILQGEGILLRRVSLIDPRVEAYGQRQELVFVDEVLLSCQPSVAELARGQWTVQHVAVRGARVRVTRGPDGQWDVEQLLRGDPLAGPLPTVSAQATVVEIVDRTGTESTMMRLDDCELSATPLVAPAAQSDGAASPPSTSRDVAWDVQVSFRNSLLRRGHVRARVSPSTGAWQAEGDLEELVVSSELIQSVPDTWLPRSAEWERFQARVAAHFSAGRARGDAPTEFAVDGQILSGRWEDARLPHHLTDLTGKFRADPSGWSAHELHASFGDAQIKMSCGADGYRPDSPKWLTGRAERVPMTSGLAERLPPSVGRVWEKFQPVGRLDAVFNVEFDGQQWRPRVDATLEDVTLTWHRFRYPLQQCRGRVNYSPDALQADLVGLVNSQQVTVQADVANPGHDFVGRVEVRSLGWITWEDRLTQALDPVPRELLESLGARGQVQVAATLDRRQPGGEASDLRLDVYVRDGWTSWDKFPWPLQSISGRMVLVDGHWTFQSFQGRNGGCVVQGAGTCQPGPFGETVLVFSATDVPLEDELRDALPASARKLWIDMAPRGSVDRVRVEWRKRHDHTPGQLHVLLHEFEPTLRADATPIVLQPSWLPYRWDDVHGTLSIENDHWSLSRLHGHHGDATIDLDASGVSTGDGGWTADLHHLTVERLALNRELLATLPPSLARCLQWLDENGRFSLQGNVSAVAESSRAAPKWTWDLLAQIDRAGFNAPLPVSNVFGQARLAGVQQGAEFRMHSLLDIESLMVGPVQLTNLKGSLTASPAGVVLGQVPGRELDGVTPTPLVCTLVGGELEVQAVLGSEPNVPFQTRCVLRGGDLREAARELGLDHQSVAGRVFADVGLTGSLDGWHTLQGSGTMRLREANVYELPQMVALLKLLDARAPDRTAFTSSDSAFRIRGDRVYFDQIDLYGDAITLKGEGEVDLRRTLNLQFYSIMGRESRWIPAIRPWLGEASRQFLLIRVQGTIEQPSMSREVLPGLNESLRRFFPELVENGGGR